MTKLVSVDINAVVQGSLFFAGEAGDKWSPEGYDIRHPSYERTVRFQGVSFSSSVLPAYCLRRCSNMAEPKDRRAPCFPVTVCGRLSSSIIGLL